MLSSDNKAWLDAFIKRYGRAPRVLHIGNIANNAYLNSKFLREMGIHSDVLCYDYFHIMGCPEWEDGRVLAAVPDPNHPVWYEQEQLAFVRPRWFVQGSLQTSLDYLDALGTGDLKSCDRLWARLAKENGTRATQEMREEDPASTEPASTDPASTDPASTDGFRLSQKLVFKLKILLFDKGASVKLAKIFSMDFLLKWPLIELLARIGLACSVLVSIPIRLIGIFLELIGVLLGLLGESIRSRRRSVFQQVAVRLGGVSQRTKVTLRETDVLMYLGVLSDFSKVFQHYDLIQGYATDGVYPMLAGRKYVAFEHGTIRKMPFEDTVQGRLCAATYLLADEVVITNADNIVAAKRLGLKRYSFVPHPVNDMFFTNGHAASSTLRSALLSELDADFLIFHPARQHWNDQRHPNWEKGNDFLIYALGRIFREKKARIGAVFVEWGESVAKSKELIECLGMGHRVKWIEPQAHQAMLEYILACDALADQFFLGAFGSTMPRALMCGRPALIYLNQELHSWCFPEMPPIINVRSADDIYDGLCRLHADKDFVERLSREGAAWYRKWHSSEFVANSLLSVYGRVLDRRMFR